MRDSKVRSPKYRRVEKDCLLKWFLEVDHAIEARHIDDEKMQLAFAKANLAGRARTWALNLQLHDPTYLDRLWSLRIFSAKRLSRQELSSGLFQIS